MQHDNVMQREREREKERKRSTYTDHTCIHRSKYHAK